jgi:ribosome-binding ATPase YchF (GTP1/OBG family)
MKVGIVGYGGVGKTSLFTVLTGQAVATHQPSERHLATVDVVDPRLDKLRDHWQPRKFTRARFEVEDEPALPRGDVANRGERVAALRDPDVLLLVVGTSEAARGQLPKELHDPIAQERALRDDLLLLDLEAIEKRVGKSEERIKKGAGDRALLVRDVEAMKRIQALVEKNASLHDVNDPDGKRLLHELKLFHDKPIVTVFNVDEATLSDRAAVEKLRASSKRAAVLSAPIEREIAELTGADLAAFLAEYNLAEPAAPLLTRSAYEALDLISFFTMGEDEVRAWPIVRGSNAVTAAGKIHSDLARGFIRAEVIPFSRIEGATDLKQLKTLGRADLMGKEYVVQDGDVLNIRFSV